MSEYRDKVIEKIARCFMIQEGYNDQFYFDNREKYFDKPDSCGVCIKNYIEKANVFLKAIPELGIVNRAAKFPEMNYSNERDNGVHQATKSKMKQEGFLKEVRE